MKKTVIAVILIAFLSFGCAGGWKAAYGIRAWTNRAMDSFEEWYDSAGCSRSNPVNPAEDKSPEECFLLREYISPPLNILHCATLAIEALEKGDDITAARYIQDVIRIGAGWGKTFPGLEKVLTELPLDIDAAVEKLEGIKLYVSDQAGFVEVKEEKGWIRRTWDKIW